MKKSSRTEICTFFEKGPNMNETNMKNTQRFKRFFSHFCRWPFLDEKQKRILHVFLMPTFLRVP